MAACIHRLLPIPAIALAVALAALTARPTIAAEPEQVTIYRCTGADGQLTLRDSPCHADARQQVIQMERPQDPPPQPPTPALPPTPPQPAVAAPPTRVVVIQPPAPVYECITPDGDHYTSDSPAGNPRWTPLWTLGYPARYSVPYPLSPRAARGNRDNAHLFNDLKFDGIGRSPPPPSDTTPGAPQLPPAVGLARTPGAWIRDRCHRLPQAQVCTRLRDRWWELRRDYHNAMQSEREQIDAEQRAIATRLAQDC